MLHPTGPVDDSDETQTLRGQGVLREVTRSQADKRSIRHFGLPVMGTRLTPTARKLRGTAGECRDKHRRFAQQGGWAKPGNGRILEEANRKHDETRLEAIRNRRTLSGEWS